jgi:(p)ppGpp synthase/HD superfamily hydrolase
VSTELTSRFYEAVRYAGELHATQTRKGTDVPYVSHLLGVASLVLEYGGDEDEAIGALLHDAAEDHGGRPRLDDIRQRFGEKVARVVEGCTDSWTTPKEPWVERKRNFVARARLLPREVLRVAAADKLHNAWAILRDLRAEGESIWTRFNASPDDVMAYYNDLVRAFREAGGGTLTAAGGSGMIDELERVTRGIERQMGY